MSYDLQDEIDSKNAAIAALSSKGLKLQDVPIKEGALSAEYGILYENTNGNPSNSQIEKWSSKDHPKYGFSYNDIFKASGGSTKMGVRTQPDKKAKTGKN